jgi:hypothetical protein
MHEWVREAGTRNMVLLGAGASVPAGLPTSADLLNALMKIEGTPALRSMLEFIRDRIAVSGRKPNIEQVFAGVSDYLYRKADPVSMFVEKWAAPQTTPDAFPDDVQADFMSSFIPFRVLSTIDELSLAAAARTDYLLPLLSPAVTSIVTLNYDLLLETVAEQHGHVLPDGADDWDGGYHWPQATSRPELIKLHGSLDWRASVRNGHVPEEPSDFLTRNRIVVERGKTSLRGPGTAIRMDAAVIFGSGNKLTSSFVFPALINRFRESLSAASTLVVVGYSFSDDHVNEAILRWLRYNPSARLVVLDIRHMESPAADIYAEVSGQALPKEPDGVLSQMRQELTRRITYVRGSAEETLAQVLYP